MNIWLHRISHHAEISHPLLDQNYLTIGFSDFSYDGFIQKILSAGHGWEPKWEVLEEEFDEIWGNRPRTRHNLWRFIEGFKKGDWVVVPKSGLFSIYEIEGDLPKIIGELGLLEIKDWNGNSIKNTNGFLYDKNGNFIDLGFYWKVKKVAENISRYDYADAALTSRLKFRSTNSLITDLKISIENAKFAFEQNKPVNIHSQLIEQIAPIVLESLKSELNPDKFERIVKWYFERIGASDVYIPSKNEKDKEGDADVVATFESIKLIIYCQVKFHNGTTDQWATQQILDYKNKKERQNQDDKNALDDDYSKISWVISSGNQFTEESVNIAKQEKIQLFYGLQFSKMLINAGFVTLNKIF